MEKLFVSTTNGTIFCRKIGIGPLLFLLHPSPRSGALMEPLMHLLQDHYTVIAPDMPGYGLSNAIQLQINSMYDYVPTMHEFFQHFGESQYSIYGTATGAQLAIAYSLKHKENVTQLYIDNAAHFEDAACETILSKYFINITPSANGSHLNLLWQHVQQSCLYFPWYENNEAHCINTELPTSNVLQAMFNDFLAAGPNYKKGYIAAFKHERAKYVQQLTIPTVLFKWLGSPILKHIETLCSFQLPSNIEIIDTEKNINERYQTMLSHFIKKKK